MAKTCIVVEMDQENFYAVEMANRGGGAELVRYLAREIPPTGVSPEWVRRIWSEAHFSQNRVVCILPDQMLRTRTVMVPALAPEQLEAAVRMELGNAVESGGESFKILNYRVQERMCQVRVVLIHQKRLSETIHFWQQAGLVVEWSGVRTSGNQSFISFNLNFFDDPSSGAAYLDLTETQTEFGVVRGDELIYCRNFPVSSTEIKEHPESGIKDLVEEIRLSTASYQAATGEPLPPKLLLFGNVTGMTHLYDQLGEQLGVKVLLPDRTRFMGMPLHAKELAARLAPLFGLGLYGIGCSEGAPQIFSREQMKTKVNRKKFIALAGMAGLVLILGVGIVLWLQAGMEREKKTQEWLRQHEKTLTQLKQLEAETKLYREQIGKLEEWLDGRNRELEFLLALDRCLPLGTRVTQFTIEKGYLKDLSGITPSVTVLLQEIRRVPELRGIKQKGTINTTPEGEVFHLDGTISVPVVDAESKGEKP